MKTQAIGYSYLLCIPPPTSAFSPVTPFATTLFSAHTRGEQNWAMKYLKQAQEDYRDNRENGTEQDAPHRELKFDGTAEWEKVLGFENDYRVRYTEGPEVKTWMEEKDRNYVFRLEFEGLLDEMEPNLRTEVPSLYQEIIASRVENKDECYLNCATSQPS